MPKRSVSPRARATTKRPCFSSSMIGAEAQVALKAAKASLGGTACRDELLGLDGCTHLVVPRGALRRTAKTLAAITRHPEVAIVTTDWVRDSFEKNCWVPPQKQPSYLPSHLPYAGRLADPSRLLQGIRFHVEDGTPDAGILTRLIKNSGGSVTLDATSADHCVTPAEGDSVRDAVCQAIFTQSLAPLRDGGPCPRRDSNGDPAAEPPLTEPAGYKPAGAARPVSGEPCKPSNAAPPAQPKPVPALSASQRQQQPPPEPEDQQCTPPHVSSLGSAIPFLTLLPQPLEPNDLFTSHVPERIDLHKEYVLLGRSSKDGVDIVMDSRVVKHMLSRKHASFNRENIDGRWKVTIKDEGATNGFFVNNIRRTKWVLKDGDVVTLGGNSSTIEGEETFELLSDCVYRYHSGDP
ncbi:Helicase-like transcription factor CHR27 [Diplonema papillatum]|nr:Helicase-like transcription factor CHR27 [Diplonema papillatum]